MNTKFDDTFSPEALIIASQAVLVGLLKELAQASPALRHAVTESLKTAEMGLQSLSKEQADPCQKDFLIKAAYIVQDMECRLGGYNKRCPR
jgi:hypothetical protein